ncbi:MAG TPA: glycosyltransferase [Bacilli bacterium]|nr:glycosyltransferase [Bacilli bacterium]
MLKIPKIIHYVWVGEKQKDELFYACLDSWKKHLGDYEIMEWSEKTFDVSSNLQVKKALEEKNYAYASDIIRVWALKEYGGVYFDTDIMITKNIDHLLKSKFFASYEAKYWLGSAVLGAIKNHPIIELIYKRYSHDDPIKFNTNVLTVHSYTAAIRYLYNYKPNGKTYQHDEFLVLASDYFYPIHYLTLKEKQTENTVGIHYYNGSWHTDKQNRGFNFAKFSRKILGRHIFSIFEKIVASSYNRTLQKDFKKLSE